MNKCKCGQNTTIKYKGRYICYSCVCKEINDMRSLILKESERNGSI